jgi:hypothetical protein
MRLDSTLKKSYPIYLGTKNLDGFNDIGRTREGPRFALYVKKIFISRVCKCATWNVFTMFTMCRKKYIHQYVNPGDENLGAHS